MRCQYRTIDYIFYTLSFLTSRAFSEIERQKYPFDLAALISRLSIYRSCGLSIDASLNDLRVAQGNTVGAQLGLFFCQTYPGRGGITKNDCKNALVGNVSATVK